MISQYFYKSLLYHQHLLPETKGTLIIITVTHTVQLKTRSQHTSSAYILIITFLINTAGQV